MSREPVAVARPAGPLEADIALGLVVDEVHAGEEMAARVHKRSRVMDDHHIPRLHRIVVLADGIAVGGDGIGRVWHGDGDPRAGLQAAIAIDLLARPQRLHRSPRRPIASRVVFRFLGHSADLHSAIAHAAILPQDSPAIELRIDRLLTEPVDSLERVPPAPFMP